MSARSRTSGSEGLQRQAGVADQAEAHGEGAPQLLRVGAELDQLGAVGQGRAVGVRVGHERAGADGEDPLVGRQRRPDGGRRRRQHPGEQRVGGRQRHRAVEGRGVDGRAERLGQVGQGVDGAGGPDVAAGDDGQLPDGRLGQQLGQLVQAAGRRPAHDGRRRRHRRVALLVEGRHRQAHEHGTAGRAGGVVEGAAHDRAQLPQRPHLVRPPADRPGQADQVAGQERVGLDVAVVLLAGGDHERRAHGLGVGEVADGVAQPGRRVQVQERRPPGGLGVAVGHAHRGGLLEAQHVVEVVGAGQGVHERQLGGAGVAEQVADAFGAQHVQQGIASGARHALHRNPGGSVPIWSPVPIVCAPNVALAR